MRNRLRGLDFWKTLKQTMPLSLATSAMCILVLVWLFRQSFCSWFWLLIICATIFALGGWIGLITNDDVARGFAAYDSIAPSLSHNTSLTGWMVRLLVYVAFAMVAFWTAYGPTKFLGAVLIGILGPFAFAHKATKQVKTVEATLEDLK